MQTVTIILFAECLFFCLNKGTLINRNITINELELTHGKFVYFVPVLKLE